MCRAWALLSPAILVLCACTGSAQPTTAADTVDPHQVEAEDMRPDDVPEVQLADPDPDSERGRALDAIETGSGFVLYSLLPRDYPLAQDSEHPYGSAEYDAEMERYLADWNAAKLASCADEKCLFMNPVLGKVAVTEPARIEGLKTILTGALGQVPDYAVACIAQYRHAISFMSGDTRYDVLLCYGCGQVSVAIDGNIGHDDQSWRLAGEHELDAILTASGIPLAPKPDI